jgi:urease accessory protein
MRTDDAAPHALLAALQLGDSGLPIGRFVHSHGVEAWLASRPAAREDELAELVETVVTESIGPLDGALIAHAHRAPDVDELARLDRALTARKLTPPSRRASRSCGRQLAALAPRLTDDTLAIAFAARVREGRSDGNLAVVEGTLARAMGVAAADAILLELRGAAAGLLSAAVRLGRIDPLRAQAVLHAMSPALARSGRDALAATLDDLRTTSPELEIHALSHRRRDARMFTT